jgi:hypothetical protein
LYENDKERRSNLHRKKKSRKNLVRLSECSTGRESQMSYVMINTECCSGKESGWLKVNFALEQATKAQRESTDRALLFF